MLLLGASLTLSVLVFGLITAREETSNIFFTVHPERYCDDSLGLTIVTPLMKVVVLCCMLVGFGLMYRAVGRLEQLRPYIPRPIPYLPFHKYKILYTVFFFLVCALFTGWVALQHYPLQSLIIASLWMTGVSGLLLMYRPVVRQMPKRKAWLHLILGAFCILWAAGILEILFWATLGWVTGPIGS